MPRDYVYIGHLKEVAANYNTVKSIERQLQERRNRYIDDKRRLNKINAYLTSPVTYLNLSTRTRKALERMGLEWVWQVVYWYYEYAQGRGIGEKTLKEIETVLIHYELIEKPEWKGVKP